MNELGILGENIMGTGFNFQAHIRLGAGAFVCGEETALLNSIEDKRGMPRPPFPAVKGLWGEPTIANNVETLACVPYILREGAAEFASCGTEKSKGTKVFALYSEDEQIQALYDEFLGKPNSHKAHELLHTTYQARVGFND